MTLFGSKTRGEDIFGSRLSTSPPLQLISSHFLFLTIKSFGLFVFFFSNLVMRWPLSNVLVVSKVDRPARQTDLLGPYRFHHAEPAEYRAALPNTVINSERRREWEQVGSLKLRLVKRCWLAIKDLHFPRKFYGRVYGQRLMYV